MPTTPAGRLAVIEELFDNDSISPEEARNVWTTPVVLGVEHGVTFDDGTRPEPPSGLQEQTFEGLSEPEPPSPFDDGTRPSPLDTDSGQYGVVGNGDYLMTIPADSGITVDTTTGAYWQRNGDTLEYRTPYVPRAHPEIEELKAKVKELEEKLKATVAFYESMVDEELEVANDDSSGS